MIIVHHRRLPVLAGRRPGSSAASALTLRVPRVRPGRPRHRWHRHAAPVRPAHRAERDRDRGRASRRFHGRRRDPHPVAYLGYLGLGIQPPRTDWGGMLSDRLTDYTNSGHWWLLYSARASRSSSSSIAFNFIGDALRDAFEVRLQRPLEQRAWHMSRAAPADTRSAPPSRTRPSRCWRLRRPATPTSALSNSRRCTRSTASSLKVVPARPSAIVGESGCGKTMTALSIMRPAAARRPGRPTDSILLRRPRTCDRSRTRPRCSRIRGAESVGMVFQDPLTSLNPTMRDRRPDRRGVRLHRGVGRDRGPDDEPSSCSRLVGIAPRPPDRLTTTPTSCPAGMRQRVADRDRAGLRPPAAGRRRADHRARRHRPGGRSSSLSTALRETSRWPSSWSPTTSA